MSNDHFLSKCKLKYNNFLVIPDELIQIEDLDIISAILFSKILQFVCNTGECYATDEYFLKFLKLTDKIALHRRFKLLEKLKLIERFSVYNKDKKKKERNIKVLKNSYVVKKLIVLDEITTSDQSMDSLPWVGMDSILSPGMDSLPTKANSTEYISEKHKEPAVFPKEVIEKAEKKLLKLGGKVRNKDAWLNKVLPEMLEEHKIICERKKIAEYLQSNMTSVMSYYVSEEDKLVYVCCNEQQEHKYDDMKDTFWDEHKHLVKNEDLLLHMPAM